MATKKKSATTKAKAKGKTTNTTKAPSRISQAVEWMQGEVKKQGGLAKLEPGARKTILEAGAKKFSLALPTMATQWQKRVRGVTNA